MFSERTFSLNLSSGQLTQQSQELKMMNKSDQLNKQLKKEHVIERQRIYVINPKPNNLTKVAYQHNCSSYQQYDVKIDDLEFCQKPNINQQSIFPQKQTSCTPTRKLVHSQNRRKTFHDILQRKRLQVFIQKNGENTQKKQPNKILEFLLNQKVSKQKINIEVNCPSNQNKSKLQQNNDKNELIQFLENLLGEHEQNQQSITVNLQTNRKQQQNEQFNDIVHQLHRLHSLFPNLKIAYKKNPTQGNPEQTKNTTQKAYVARQKFELKTIAQQNNSFKLIDSQISPDHSISLNKRQGIQNIELQLIKKNCESEQIEHKPIFNYLLKKVLSSENTIKQHCTIQTEQNTQIKQEKQEQQQKLQLIDFKRFENRRKTRNSIQKMTLGLRRGSYSQDEIKKITQRVMQPKKFVIVINRVDVEEQKSDQQKRQKKVAKLCQEDHNNLI